MKAVVHTSITEIEPRQWNNLFSSDYPFLHYGFFLALEKGGSLGPQRGWVPRYVMVYDNDIAVAAMPWFKKTHSYGEYLFDWAFAEAFERYGFQYYPKLVNAIPFTPCQGPRLGLCDSLKANQVLPLIESALLVDEDVSNLQCLYVEEDLGLALQEEGWWQRYDIQFLWKNRNYLDFDDFLSRLVSRKRKSLRKERLKVASQGIEMKTLAGDQLTAEFWSAFAQLYQLTYLKRSGHGGYLTPETLKLWGQYLAESIVVFAAYHEQKMVAASLCFKDSNTLYGRYWGCLQEFDFLHFEACYYQGIEYCIEHGLQHFDAGAQGEHKLHRGFEPVLRQGFYRFQPSPLTDAVEDYCQRERKAINEHCKMLSEHSPYKQSP
ncbi:GNAT family N-acetyltransferase [Idiomarina seosinensis]|uniref:GNAT family N-acetyltransferase n=1 Tax=Idiomarina seosinensis TaxID=281739 RepID=A0A432Z6S1_9GAMM|nr:GNAT family N-acetyltransferase [Idiomarina seosinensis]RUO73587.1 GNAT family N-acetyltransferase [Idiomarina seosinensis]